MTHSVRRAPFVARCAELQANNPLFKERAPELRVAYRYSELSPGVPASVALHGVSLASDDRRSRGRRRFGPTARENRLPLTLPCESCPAGPHERCRRSNDPERLPSPRAPSEPGNHSSTSATDAKVERTRERPVTPRDGVLGADGGQRRPAGGRAPVTRLGVELPLYRSPRLDQASARGTRGLLESKAGTLVGQKSGREPGEASTYPVPRGPPSTCRANGRVVERARVPSRRSEPRLFTAARPRLQRSQGRRPFFTHATAHPRRSTTATRAAEKPPR